MSVLIFIIVLSVLVFVHELGHLLAAKATGMRVDEFGLGYPPRAKKLFSWRGTDFTLNWLPFGGFVKIYGENPDQENLNDPRSFASKNRGAQALVLVSGVAGNILLAWILISVGFLMGMPAPEGMGLPVENPRTVITEVVPGSPADLGGLKSGDAITALSRDSEVSVLTASGVSEFISRSQSPVDISVERGEETFSVSLAPREGIVPGKSAVGFGLANVGTVELGFFKAFIVGAKLTYELTILTAQALWTFISQAVIGRADFSTVAGPVGIAGMMGGVTDLGLVYLLTFTALISINLAIINLFPFPALDGGRLLFVGIESLTRRRIPARVFNVLNTAGFALLILLMILVTIRDVRNIF